MCWCAVTIAGPSWAGEVVISDDGRQIQLNADGSWVQLSQDRYATNSAGQRIRLAADGRWSVISADTRQTPSLSAQQPRLDEPVLLLDEVQIIRRQISRAKSKHSESRMRFVLRIDNQTSKPVAIPQHLQQHLQVLSNRGSTFDILSVTAAQTTVQPATQTELVIWAKDAPSWFGTKFLQVVVPAGMLGNRVAIKLSRNMDSVKRVEVDRF